MRPDAGKSTHAAAGNLLLAALPGRDLRHLLARCEQVELVLNDVLYQPGELIRYVLFPTASYISLIIPVGEHDRARPTARSNTMSDLIPATPSAEQPATEVGRAAGCGPAASGWPPAATIRFRARQFEFRFPRPVMVMGIVNVTPD